MCTPITLDNSKLSVLNQDVLLRILVFCEIPGVLSMSQTCKQLYALAFDKQVWLGLTRSYPVLHASSNPSLSDLSTPELVDLAKRAVRGPISWSPSQSGSEITRQNVVHSIKDDPESPMKPKLVVPLPGGRYILCQNQHTVECWDFVEVKKVWQYSSWHKGSHVQSFAVDVIEDDKTAVILIGEQVGALILDPSEPEARRNFMNILSVDLHSGVGCTLFVVDTPYLGKFSRPTICGDLAAIRIHDRIIIANWKTQSCILLCTSLDPDDPIYDVYDISVISGHIVFAFHAHPTKEEALTARLYIWSMESLDNYWCPTSSVSNLEAIWMDDIPCPTSASDLTEIPYLTCRSVSLSVHGHPFHDGIHKIWLLVTTYQDVPSEVYEYSLVLDPSRSPLLRLHTSFTVDGRLGKYASISYAGYTCVSRRDTNTSTDHRLILNVRDNDGVDLKLPCTKGCIHFSDYSGALVYYDHVQDAIVVNYYK